jgi:hypothetical protein
MKHSYQILDTNKNENLKVSFLAQMGKASVRGIFIEALL